MQTPPLRLGMIGGGQEAFIGGVHRAAARLDGRWVFTAGALSSTRDRALASAKLLGLAPDRSYGTWREMLERESALPPSERVDAVAIVTPNAAHFEPALAFVNAGFHLMIDKPLTTTLRDALALQSAARAAGVLVAVSYNYTGYPLVRHAAALIRAGAIGPVRKVFVQHHQGWLASPIETTGQKQAAWRTDPALAGPAGSLADIGAHAENLLSFITGLEIESLAADLASFVPGRRVDDDAAALLRLSTGARAVLTASQVCLGEENNLAIRVHGEAGSLWWSQESPDVLVHADPAGRRHAITRASPNLDPAAVRATRLPPGHPEGFLEAFANLYADFADGILSLRAGAGLPDQLPSIDDGVRGVRFIERALHSARSNGAWVPFV